MLGLRLMLKAHLGALLEPGGSAQYDNKMLGGK